ncbi:hypothetical protein CO608_08460 [Lysobacteraceae bacterium NML08-0793]|nr:hypothetical protein CO608_08460 [Xanthomonadaceae bacterium NML08-0793]
MGVAIFWPFWGELDARRCCINPVKGRVARAKMPSRGQGRRTRMGHGDMAMWLGCSGQDLNPQRHGGTGIGCRSFDAYLQLPVGIAGHRIAELPARIHGYDVSLNLHPAADRHLAVQYCAGAYCSRDGYPAAGNRAAG